MEPIPEQVLELVSKVMQPTSVEETLENFKTIGPGNVRVSILGHGGRVWFLTMHGIKWFVKTKSLL